MKKKRLCSAWGKEEGVIDVYIGDGWEYWFCEKCYTKDLPHNWIKKDLLTKYNHPKLLNKMKPFTSKEPSPPLIFKRWEDFLKKRKRKSCYFL